MTSQNQPANLIEYALNYDPLSEAERITGSSYKDDESTAFLGMALSFENSRLKNEILKVTKDTCSSNTVDQDIAVIEDMGFQLLQSAPFTSVSGGVTSEEKWFIYWKEGILVFFDTFHGGTNGGHAYFNLLMHPNEDDRYSLQGFSGGYTRAEDGSIVAVGSIDIREGFRYKIQSMSERGSFITKWVDQPFLWLLHHMEPKVHNYNYQLINGERIALLPAEVQNAIASSP